MAQSDGTTEKGKVQSKEQDGFPAKKCSEPDFERSDCIGRSYTPAGKEYHEQRTGLRE